MNITYRSATKADANALTRIAIEAKQFWGYPEDMLRLWEADLTITPKFIETNRVYLATDTHQVLGFVALINQQDYLEIEHMWVHPSVMRKHIGKTFMEYAFKTCKALNYKYIRVVSDPNAKGFYQKFGGKHISDLPSKPASRLLPVLEFNIHTFNE